MNIEKKCCYDKNGTCVSMYGDEDKACPGLNNCLMVNGPYEANGCKMHFDNEMPIIERVNEIRAMKTGELHQICKDSGYQGWSKYKKKELQNFIFKNEYRDLIAAHRDISLKLRDEREKAKDIERYEYRENNTSEVYNKHGYVLDLFDNKRREVKYFELTNNNDTSDWESFNRTIRVYLKKDWNDTKQNEYHCYLDTSSLDVKEDRFEEFNSHMANMMEVVKDINNILKESKVYPESK